MKQRIKLTESQLHNMIQETVREVLNETLFDLPQHLTKKVEMDMDFKELEDKNHPNRGRTPEGWSQQNDNITNSWDISGGSYSLYDLNKKKQQMNQMWDEHGLEESVNESYNQYGVWDLIDELKEVMSVEDILTRVIARISPIEAKNMLEDILSIEGPERDEYED